MNKCYYRIVWENYPSDKTPLNEQNLNKIDVAVDEMDNRIISLDSTKFNKSEANLLVKYIEYDEDTGVFKITHYNGASYTIDTLLEKLAINFDYDYQTQRLIIELSDGTIKYVDLSALITQYEFSDSDTVHFTVSADGKVTASVKDGSIQEKHLQPNYLADIKVEVAKAEASKTAASTSEANAKASENAAKASENASAESAENSSTSAANAAISANTASSKAIEAANSAASAATSATTATNKANEAFTSATNAANSASTATNKANAASTSATNAENSATSAETYAKQAQSYAVGTGGARPNEANDNAKKYYEQSKEIYDNFNSAGNVTGVKGNAETAYRTGNVNLTAANIGALSLSGGTLDGSLIPAGGIEYAGRSGYIAYPDDGYLAGSVINTGYILIQLPEGPTSYGNIGVNFTVTMVNFIDNTSAEYHLSGYVGNVWSCCTAYCVGKSGASHSNLSVRFGKYNGRIAVSIGESTTQNRYLGVKIHDITISHNGIKTFAAWKSGWNVEVTTTGLSTIDKTIDNTHVAYGCVAGSCIGNAATATKATQDSVGNVIKNTYLNMNTGGTVVGDIVVKSSDSTFVPATTIGSNCSFSDDAVKTYPGSPMNVKYGITIQSQQGNFPCSIDGNSIVHAGNIGNYAPSYETGTCSFTYSGQSSPIMTGIYRKINTLVFVAAEGNLNTITKDIPVGTTISGLPYPILKNSAIVHFKASGGMYVGDGGVMQALDSSLITGQSVAKGDAYVYLNMVYFTS